MGKEVRIVYWDRWLKTLPITIMWGLRRREKENQKRRQFLAERREDLGAAISELAEITSKLITECGPVGLGPEFVEKAKLLPFYAMGEVLSAQGEIFPEQKAVLEITLTNLNPMYNFAQFTEAAIHRTGVYQEYWDVVGLGKEACGSLWLTLFELVYRSRMIEAVQQIDNQLSYIVISFAYLRDTDVSIAESTAKHICDRILDCINHHVNAYQQTPYIHALMLLQKMLLEKRELAIEKHFFLQDEEFVQDGRSYYVFGVYEKFSQNYCGKFAVRKIKSINGKLDYQNDGDQILVWNETTDNYEVFYQELL